MAPDTETVNAEVLLRQPDSAKAARVARHLEQQGITVGSVGAASVSIRCSRATFEKVFQTQLAQGAQARAPEGVYDYGGVGGAFETSVPVAVPEALAEDVEGIYVQPTARYLEAHPIQGCAGRRCPH
jgi:hypothetical protein